MSRFLPRYALGLLVALSVLPAAPAFAGEDHSKHIPIESWSFGASSSGTGKTLSAVLLGRP
ncbi:hypothetical protein DVA67_006950 [Solirubrobacter sp. CPCC 204708]|uniref:Uncharacterized protein n=1 Tax=Solirubrobacter deserti TaxID=2282478 RepID=A0ABT4RPJ3_9ACTN|nr:hypothetical protein [Solirubrobacter deserti]MBE2315706.1 hypothetical protein [Solirubrobacter deserti]MDA0140405.1 hypothetical protein [Solirubrobacter deserti]